MLKTITELKNLYSNYKDVNGKISREISKGNLYPIKRGLYETDASTSGEYLAQVICSPSYLSFDYALYYYSLIPEAVYNTYTCATFQKNKTKVFTNNFGTYIYRDIPAKAYPYCVRYELVENYSYHIASPEKAICDKLYSLPIINNLKNLQVMLFEDLRIDDEIFWNLNLQDMCDLAPLYNSTNLKLLAKLIKRSKKWIQY